MGVAFLANALAAKVARVKVSMQYPYRIFHSLNISIWISMSMFYPLTMDIHSSIFK